MIRVACYNCGSTDERPYATENGWKLVKCASCGLLYVNPRPTDDEIYRGTQIGLHQGEHPLESKSRYLAVKVALYHQVLTDIYGSAIGAGGVSWLDVGCGYGELLETLKRFGIEAKGLELNLHKRAAARSKGLDVDDFDLSTHNKSYDVISLLNVYSHLPNPPDFLGLIRQRLRPDGEVLLETGDTANLPSHRHTRPFGLPDHLSFASEQILSSVLKSSGFSVISVTRYPAVNLAFMKMRILIEAVKVFLPNKKSQLPWMYSQLRVAKYRTDMWVRARAT
jgi:SAM-dependent methyltransferase